MVRGRRKSCTDMDGWMKSFVTCVIELVRSGAENVHVLDGEMFLILQWQVQVTGRSRQTANMYCRSEA